jgi:hypothetical protein
MAEKELTADKMDKLDRLLAFLASFAEVDQVMDLPMMRVLALVCRHDGAN